MLASIRSLPDHAGAATGLSLGSAAPGAPLNATHDQLGALF
jgi:hypothetical protein